MDIGQAYAMACQRLGAAVVESGALLARIAELEAQLASQSAPSEPGDSETPQ